MFVFIHVGFLSVTNMGKRNVIVGVGGDWWGYGQWGGWEIGGDMDSGREGWRSVGRGAQPQVVRGPTI